MSRESSLPRIGVLAGEGSFYFDDLARAAQGLAEVVRLDFSALAAHIGHTETILAPEPVTSRFDAVIVRSMPLGSLQQVVFRMDVLATLERQGTLVINPPKSMELTIDKYLSLSRLAAAGFCVPETCVCQTWQAAMQAFEQLGANVVVKPIFGGEGRGVMRVDDPDLALRVFKTLDQLREVIYVQRFVPHAGYDLRVLVLGDQLWSMRRTAADTWRTNLSRGATAQPEAIPAHLAQLARTAADELGLVMAGLDFLPADDGQWYLLEANAVPGWKGLARACQVDIAQKLIEYILRRVRCADRF